MISFCRWLHICYLLSITLACKHISLHNAHAHANGKMHMHMQATSSLISVSSNRRSLRAQSLSENQQATCLIFTHHHCHHHHHPRNPHLYHPHDHHHRDHDHPHDQGCLFLTFPGSPGSHTSSLATVQLGTHSKENYGNIWVVLAIPKTLGILKRALIST